MGTGPGAAGTRTGNRCATSRRRWSGNGGSVPQMTDATLAAGAAIWRPAADTPQGSPGAGDAEVLLVHRPRYDDWSLPKGKSEPGEHILLTATREVAEETGLRVVLGRPLGPSLYQVSGRPKHVSYWVARCAGSLGFTAGHEVDDLAWLDLPRVPQRL